MKLILVRHGETEWNATGRVQGEADIPLNRKGLEQAKKVSARLKTEPIDIIYSSSMKRARQTTEAIMKFHKVPIRYSNLLRERKFGKLGGMPNEEYRRIREKEGIEFHLFRPPGGENYVDLQKRVKKFLAMIRKEHGSQTVVVVSHGGVIRTIITILTKRPLANVHEIEQHNASINVIELRSGSPPKIHYLNSTEHL
ncbi:MAG: histidine phosphatase family protein [Candidatus Aenigmarchaeota archaeon]|nr:histidine phosphatase family protein [Candidatus Aenigmarchaeota archaeon]